ncbi:MAG: hypothetical protein ACRCYO_02695 [Bacteroidia bacterium]
MKYLTILIFTIICYSCKHRAITNAPNATHNIVVEFNSLCEDSSQLPDFLKLQNISNGIVYVKNWEAWTIRPYKNKSSNITDTVADLLHEQENYTTQIGRTIKIENNLITIESIQKSFNDEFEQITIKPLANKKGVLLISYTYSSPERSDFAFYIYEKKSKEWNNKTNQYFKLPETKTYFVNGQNAAYCDSLHLVKHKASLNIFNDSIKIQPYIFAFDSCETRQSPVCDLKEKFTPRTFTYYYAKNKKRFVIAN